MAHHWQRCFHRVVCWLAILRRLAAPSVVSWVGGRLFRVLFASLGVIDTLCYSLLSCCTSFLISSTSFPLPGCVASLNMVKALPSCGATALSQRHRTFRERDPHVHGDVFFAG